MTTSDQINVWFRDDVMFGLAKSNHCKALKKIEVLMMVFLIGNKL